MTHICASKLGDYLSQCWNIINWILGNKSQWNFSHNLTIFTQEIAFEKCRLESFVHFSRPQCVNSSWPICNIYTYENWIEIIWIVACRLFSAKRLSLHYSDYIMSAMASQITGVSSVYWTFFIWRKSKKTSKLRVSGLCKGNSPVTDEFPAQMASNAEKVSIWCRHHGQ